MTGQLFMVAIDSSRVLKQLRGGLQHIYSTLGAFAALKDDGSVVTHHEGVRCIEGLWGRSLQSRMTGQLSHGVLLAFAALKDDGSVVTWGQLH